MNYELGRTTDAQEGRSLSGGGVGTFDFLARWTGKGQNHARLYEGIFITAIKVLNITS